METRSKWPIQGPRSKFSSAGAKEECVKENFCVGPGGGGGGMLVRDFFPRLQ